MKSTHVIYQPGSTNVQSIVYKDAQGLLRAAYTAENPFDNNPKDLDKRADEYLAELNRNLAKDEPDFQLLTWEEALPQITAAEDKEYPTPWVEISEDRWNEMRNILPPCRWRTIQGVELFYVSEAYASNFHEHFARRGDRYFTRRCRSVVSYADLAAEVWAFEALTDRRFPEGMKEPTKCALCPRVLPFADTYAPGDDAICPECDTEVTGRQHPGEYEADRTTAAKGA